MSFRLPRSTYHFSVPDGKPLLSADEITRRVSTGFPVVFIDRIGGKRHAQMVLDKLETLDPPAHVLETARNGVLTAVNLQIWSDATDDEPLIVMTPTDGDTPTVLVRTDEGSGGYALLERLAELLEYEILPD